MTWTYKDAGVDIDAGDELVERIKPLAKATRTREVLGDVGGFAGLCALPPGLAEPILVSGTDGVGTKLKVAFLMNRHDTIGFDLVGMCVNDVVTSGAKPLFFLDYFATSKLDVGVAESVISGIATACRESGCALLGGETAELPGMYAPGEYDLAGFSVGVVEKKKIVDGTRVSVGDVAIGVPSSGLHSNGYSLARKVLLDVLKVTDAPPVLEGRTVGEALLAPTRLYAKHVEALLPVADVRAMSHITGGGLGGNVPRVLPEGIGLLLRAAWELPPVVKLLLERGADLDECYRTFNMGIGFVVVVPPQDRDAALAALSALGEKPLVLGEIVPVGTEVAFESRVQFEKGLSQVFLR